MLKNEERGGKRDQTGENENLDCEVNISLDLKLTGEQSSFCARVTSCCLKA